MTFNQVLYWKVFERMQYFDRKVDNLNPVQKWKTLVTIEIFLNPSIEFVHMIAKRIKFRQLCVALQTYVGRKL